MKKILVIEDEPSVRENIRQILENFNYKVEMAENGVKGIELAGSSMPDLILCDIMMPDLDGFEVLETLNRKDETSAIPFVFLTALSDMSDLRHGMNLGADDYLVKPFKTGDLVRVIETRLKKKENIIGHEIRQNKEKAEHQLTNDSVIFIGTPPEVLKLNNLIYIEAYDVYTEINLASGRKLLVRKLLKEWESALSDKQFLRIRSSIIINLEYLVRVEKWFNGSLRIYMKNLKEPLEVSKRYTAKVKASLKF